MFLAHCDATALVGTVGLPTSRVMSLSTSRLAEKGISALITEWGPIPRIWYPLRLAATHLNISPCLHDQIGTCVSCHIYEGCRLSAPALAIDDVDASSAPSHLAGMVLFVITRCLTDCHTDDKVLSR